MQKLPHETRQYGSIIKRRPTIALKEPTRSGLQSFELPSMSDAHSRGSASAEGERIIAEAHATAQQMLDQARMSRDAEIEAARQTGYREGFTAAQEAVDREAAELIATSEAIAANVARERQLQLDECEADVVRLAIAVAERLVNAAVAFEPELVLDVCRGAMRKAFQREMLVVLAHPDDLSMLRDAGPQMAAQLGGVQQLEFVEERRLQRGSVVVRTPAGEIDGTFGSKAATIERELLELAERRRAERRSADADAA